MPRGERRELEARTFIRERLYAGDRSAADRYRELVIGREASWWKLFRYETITSLFGPIPGAVGLALRKVLFPGLFGSVGGELIVGRGVTVRHPHKIHLGRGVVLDDYCVLDARGAGERGIVIGDRVIIGRNATLLAKKGDIEIGGRSNIGAASVIISRGGIRIGEAALIGGECHISGGVFHTDDLHEPVMDQGIYTRGPIVIGGGVWLGMKVGVLDAVRIGDGCVIGAGAVVNRDVPDYAVAAGVPARVLKSRTEKTSEAPGRGNDADHRHARRTGEQ